MRRTLVAALALTIVITLAGLTHAGDDPLADLDSYVEQALSAWQVPGLAMAIVKDQQIVCARGYGVRDVRQDSRVDADTIFAIASNTKAFTATALGLLVHDGTITWDDPVIARLPDFQMYDPVVTRAITIRDLLCHRSGLGEYSGDLMTFGSVYDRDEVIRRIRYIEPAFDFRTGFGYSNLMFAVAGQVIPAVTESSWGEFLEERFFKPLGMTRTNTSVSDLEGMDNVATPHAWVDETAVPVPYDQVDNSAPAGAINSCVSDMARWLLMQTADGAYEGQQLVDPSVIAETRIPHNLDHLSDEAEKLNPWTHFVTYGLGWGLSDYQGRLVVSHGGGLDGMYSYVGMLPEESLGVVVLTNRDSHGLMRALGYHVFDLYLGTEFRDWSARALEAYEERQRERDEKIREREEARVNGTTPSHPLEDFAGTYQDAVYGPATITLGDGRLTLDPEAHPDITCTLEHWHYDTFLCTWSSPIWDTSLVHFDRDDDGNIARFRVTVRPDWIDTREYVFVRQQGEDSGP